ncbi:aldehyde dehydrogenase family protein [Gordonia terrae]|uniref:Aldehyde dehydrogenase n=2 Tax=Gordonia terrae TaxID=2055 RepID=A0AAD0KF84_9ACTN|nr:aldehyde dehydrogenase family protein [Gordonia terrae]VTR10805.1 betaine-aldehyde dehydrogenase [Clostridioides difficile]ANY24374.1 aldehyde dehydrogenase [Gordonia terrae]AWO85121.1 aldehyde dehydrogenase [Gordonia terrae]VTS58669.1 Phenylacetaldehyde dehydrogenase [Gordonia terrae]GAB46750.1 putative aldehyde dehydrogenase [Gordonia terrae NBRC 100016]
MTNATQGGRSTTRQADFSLVIDGKLVAGSSSFGVINPATERIAGVAPAADEAQLNSAVTAASLAAGSSWATDEDARREAMIAAADALEAESPRIAEILTDEQGKPLADAVREIATAGLWLRHFARLDDTPEVIQDDTAGYAEVRRSPLGVVAAITPWNFPIALAMWKIAPALRTGNTLVLKPSPYTPLATLAVGEVFARHLPAGVLNVVTGPDPLGAQLTAHKAVRKISFTGSTATGKRVAAAAAADLKRVTLELGGNDPAIILDDADPQAIAEDLFWGAFRNNGQVCLAVKRAYVHESIYREVVDLLSDIAKSITVGAGREPDSQLGPLNNRPQYERVKDLTTHALDRGAARATAGGKPISGVGYFFEPTILEGVTDEDEVVAEEQFGPVLPVLSFRGEQEAIARANSTDYGLTASVWSQDPERARAIGDQLDCGQVSINQHGSAVRPDLPFGGHKSSGLGVENGRWGLAEYTQLQAVVGPSRQ